MQQHFLKTFLFFCFFSSLFFLTQNLNGDTHNAELYNQFANTFMSKEVSKWTQDSNKKMYMNTAKEIRKLTSIIYKELLVFDNFIHDCIHNKNNETDSDTYSNSGNVARVLKILENKDRVENYTQNPFNHLDKPTRATSTQAVIDFILRPELFKSRVSQLLQENPLNSAESLKKTLPSFLTSEEFQHKLQKNSADLRRFQEVKTKALKTLGQHSKNMKKLKTFILKNKAKLLSCRSKRNTQNDSYKKKSRIKKVR